MLIVVVLVYVNLNAFLVVVVVSIRSKLTQQRLEFQKKSTAWACRNVPDG